MNYLLILLLGGCTGLRSMTPMAVLCWFAYRNALHFSGWRTFTAHLITVVLFTLFALGEYVGDKLPKTPSRTSAIGLTGRILLAGLAGLTVAQPLLLSGVAAALVGIVGAVAGAYGGWFVRTRTVKSLGCPDWPVALAEDAVAIGLSITFLHLLAVHAAMFLGNEGL